MTLQGDEERAIAPCLRFLGRITCFHVLEKNEPPIFVSILVPVLNEEQHLESCLESILANGFPHDRLEIIIADGGSTDGSRAIVGSFSERHPFIRLINNPGRNQASGVNLAAQAASVSSKYLIRLDAHALYPAGFLQQCVKTAEATGAGVVVYVNFPLGKTSFQKVAAAAFRHPLGTGGSAYRIGLKSGPAEHGQHGCFKRELFLELGGYDPDLAPNEDSELSRRIRMSGAVVWLEPQLLMTYFPRSSLRGLYLQYYRYGKARFRHLLKHHAWPLPRQALPAILVVGHTFCLLLTLWHSVFLLLFIPYFLTVVAGSAQLAVSQRSWGMLRSLLIFPVLHHAWGIGFWVQSLKSLWPLGKKTGEARA